MDWYSRRLSGMRLYTFRGEWKIPKHLMGAIVRTLLSIMVLSTGNIVFPIYEIGGATPSWVITSVNLLWIVTVAILIGLLGRFRLLRGEYDPSMRLFALTMLAGWWSLAVMNLGYITLSICRCYISTDQDNDLDYCALFGIGNFDVSSSFAIKVSNGQWTAFSWITLVLMMWATCAPGWDWTRQHAKIRERITLMLEEARRRNSYV